jgi:hypothetical protein
VVARSRACRGVLAIWLVRIGSLIDGRAGMRVLPLVAAAPHSLEAGCALVAPGDPRGSEPCD